MLINIIIQCYALWNHEPGGPISVFPAAVNSAFVEAQGEALTHYQGSGQILYEMGYCTDYKDWAMKCWNRL